MLVNDISNNQYESTTIVVYLIGFLILLGLIVSEILNSYRLKRKIKLKRDLENLLIQENMSNIFASFSEHILSELGSDSKVPWDVPHLFDYEGKTYEITLFKKDNKPFVKILYIKDSDNGNNAKDI